MSTASAVAHIDTSAAPSGHLRLDLLTLDPRLQARVAVDEQVVTEYAEAIAGGAILPPITVVIVADQLLVVDGWHRLAAHRQAQAETIAVDARVGTWADALRAALGANASHGLRRSQADKRRAVRLLLTDPDLAALSNRDAGAIAGVSHAYVGQVRKLYGLGPREVLTAQRIEEVDGEPSPLWREALAAAPSYDQPNVEALRQARTLGDATKAASKLYTHLLGPKCLELWLGEHADQPWPWLAVDPATRCEQLDTVVDIEMALMCPDCPAEARSVLVRARADLLELPKASDYVANRIAAAWPNRPGIVAAAQVRLEELAAERAARPPDDWEQAEAIVKLTDLQEQVAAVAVAATAAVARLQLYQQTAPELRQAILGRLEQGGYTLTACPNPACVGMTVGRPDSEADWHQCNACRAYLKSNRDLNVQGLDRVAGLLRHAQHALQVPVEFDDVIVDRRAVRVLASIMECRDMDAETFDGSLPPALAALVRAWLEPRDFVHVGGRPAPAVSDDGDDDDGDVEGGEE